MNQSIPGYLVSIWADPDVGEATFHILLESNEDASRQPVSQVEMWASPASERLPKVVYSAEPQSSRGVPHYLAQPYFDKAEPWTVGFRIRLADGTRHELFTTVEATPPGYGSWDLLIYLFPFILFGGLWAVAFIRRSRAAYATRERGSIHS